jgi:glycosyltransferase involved in cell wall biosynthesis
MTFRGGDRERWHTNAEVSLDMSSRAGHIISMSDYYGDEGPGTGGAGLSALRIADVLRRAGVDVSVIAGFAYPRDRRSEDHVTFLDGADLRESSKRSRRALLAGLWNEPALDAVRERLDGIDTETSVIQVHQWTRFLSPATLSLLNRFPHIVYVHDYFWACPTGAYFNYRKNEPCDLLPAGTKCVCTTCDRVGGVQKGYRLLRHFLKEAVVAQSAPRRLFIHISDKSRLFLEQLYPRSTHATIYHPVGNVPVPVPTPLIYDVGYFGRLEPEKGILELAAAAERTGKRCLLVGSGGEEAALRERYPNVTILGWAARDRVFELMRSCRSIALPSLWSETWGSIIPEALSQSVPVLASSNAGSAELVTKFGGGIAFDPASPPSFDAALQRITAEHDTFSREAGHAFAAAGLDEASYVRKYVELIRRTFGLELLEQLVYVP